MLKALLTWKILPVILIAIPFLFVAIIFKPLGPQVAPVIGAVLNHVLGAANPDTSEDRQFKVGLAADFAAANSHALHKAAAVGSGVAALELPTSAQRASALDKAWQDGWLKWNDDKARLLSRIRGSYTDPKLLRAVERQVEAVTTSYRLASWVGGSAQRRAWCHKLATYLGLRKSVAWWGVLIRHDDVRTFQREYAVIVEQLSAKEQNIGELLRAAQINLAD